jgi:hypothetical protein
MQLFFELEYKKTASLEAVFKIYINNTIVVVVVDHLAEHLQLRKR